MSTVTVNYAMQGTGSLDSDLDQTANKLDKVADKADEADKAVGKLAKNRERLEAFSKNIGENVENFAAVVEVVGKVTQAIHGALSMNHEYSNSVAHVTDEFTRLGQSAMDAVGPKVAGFLDRLGVGFVYLGNLIPDVMRVAFQFLHDGFRDNLIFATEVINQIRYIWDQFRSGEVIDLDKVLMDLQGANALLVVDFQTAMADIFQAEDQARKAAFEAFQRQKQDIVTEVKAAKDTFTGQAMLGDLASGMQIVSKTFAAGLKAGLLEASEAFVQNLQAGIEASVAQTQQNMKDLGAASMANAAGGMAALSGGGGLSATLTILAGPLGTLVGTVLDFVKNLPEIGFQILEEVMDIYLNLDEWVGEFLGRFFPSLIRMMPLIAGSFATLLPRIFGEVINAMPTIAAAFINAFLNAIPIIMAHVRSELKEFGQEFMQSLSPFKKPGDLFNTSLGPNAETKRLFGIKLPFQGDRMADGGVVLKSGLAWVDKGETFSGARNGRPMHGGGPGVTINIGSIVSPDPRAVVQQIRQLQGNFGTGLTLNPLVTSG